MAAPTVAERPPDTERRSQRNQDLEGVRAIAALAVLLTHVSLNAMGNRGPFGGLLARLDVGVAVFFVVSGYLLYRPFVEALLRDGSLPPWRRYLRHRLVRIVPAYWLVVLVSFLFQPSSGHVLPTVGFNPAPQGTTSVPLTELGRFLSFTQVYWKDSVAGPLPQAWTLAVEMAFYLLLPVLALLLARTAAGTRVGRLRQQYVVLAAMVGLAQVYRLVLVLVDRGFNGDPATTVIPAKAWLPNHLDLFAIGMAFALWSVESRDRGPGAGIGDRLDRCFARRGVAEASWAVALGSLLVAGYALGLSRTDLVYGRAGEFTRQFCYAVTAAALVLPAVFGRDGGGPVRGFLRSRPMQFLGKISYGIYLWQLVAIGRWVSAPSYVPGVEPEAARHPGMQFQVPFWSTLAWTLVVTIALSTATWFLVEKPWLRFRDRRLGWFTGGLWVVSLLSFASRIWGFSRVTTGIPGNGDPFFYHSQANMLADGVGFGEPIQWLTEHRFVASAIHPPIFTLWLTPSSILGARGFVAHKTMAAIAGTLVVVVAALLARRLAGPRAGLIAAVLVALYPNLWIIDGTLWPEGLYTATVGLALLAAYRWNDRPSRAAAIGLGLACGIAILTRGEALLLIPMLIVPLVVLARRREPRWLQHGALMLLATGLLVAPWTLRNLITYHQVVPVSTNSEEVLYYANCDDSYHGTFIGYWSFMCQERERAARVAAGLPADPPGNEAQRASAWGDLGVEYAKHHKRRIPFVVAARVSRVWDLRYGDNNARAIVLEGRPLDWARAGMWTWRLLLIPGLVGLWVLRRRRVETWPLVMMLVMITATAVYAYGHVRFRTVGDLVVILGTAVLVDTLWSRARERVGPSTAGGTGGGAASLVARPWWSSTVAAGSDADTGSALAGSGGAGDAEATDLDVATDPDVARDADADADGGDARDDDPGERSWNRWRFDPRTAAVVALVAAAIAVPLRALFRYQGPPMEEGFMLVFPELVLGGKVPHKDFLHLYGPGSLWALAAWYKALGVSLTAERLFGLGQLAGIVFGVMALVRPWGRRVMAASGLVGVLLCFTAIGLTALAWDGAVALLLASTWAGLRGRRWLMGPPDDTTVDPETAALRWFLGSGLLTGFALLFRPDVIVAVACVALTLFAGLTWRQRLRWVAGAAVSGLGYLYLFATAGPGAAIEGMVLEPVFKLRGGRSLPRPPSWSHFDGALQKVAALREPSWPLPALRSPAQAFVWFFLLPAVVVFIVAVGAWSVRRDPTSWRARVVLTVGMLSLGLMPQALQRADSTHLAWVSCVPLAFLPAAIVEAFRTVPVLRRSPVRRQAPWVAVVVTLVIPLFVIPHFTARTYLDLSRQSLSGDVFGWPVRNGGRTFYLGSPEIAASVQQMIDEIGPQMEPGQRLIVGTADLRRTPYSDAYLYYLFPEQVPGTRYIEMDPGMADAQGSGLAEEVDRADWLMLSHIWDGWSEPNTSLDYGSNAPNEAVDAHFCRVADFGAPGATVPYFEVYRRCR